jgi:lysophospholipase L1-like esterase
MPIDLRRGRDCMQDNSDFEEPAMTLKLSAHSKLVLIGDSITDCGRAQPIGEGLFDALGKGYVSVVDAALGAFVPQAEIRVVNVGTSGHTVRDLKKRWQSDVLDLKPDWLSIMIGVNDVWRQHDLPLQREIHVGLDEYRSGLDALIRQTLPTLKGLILMTPFYIEPNRADKMRALMDRYGEAVKELAGKHNAVLIDTQAAFDRVLAHGHHSAKISWDRVHPNATGHMVLARAFLDGIGFDWGKAS